MNSKFPAWVHQSVFYQIFPERFYNGDISNDPENLSVWGSKPGLDNFFGGDLKGVMDRFPYLKELGINAIYLNPIFKARTNHKYDASDYLIIESAFGDLAFFKLFVERAHQQGIRIVLDAVFNHCGFEFWAFQDYIRNGEHSQYREWFLSEGYPIQQNPVNYQTCGGTYYLPKLNVENAQVRAHLLHVAKYWIEETGIDGWRLDVPWKVPMDFWQEFREVVKSANPEAYIVAECWRDPQPWVNGETADGIMNYPLRDYILDYCVYDHMDAEDFHYFLSRLLDLYGDAGPYQLNLTGSHDTARLLTLCKGDQQRMLLAIVAAFTLPGTPMIYYGDEIGMEGENDPDCRRCMNWEKTDWDQKIYSTHKKLIAVRKQHSALQTGKLEALMVFNGVYVFQRMEENDNIVVILNPRETRKDFSINVPAWSGKNISLNDVLSGNTYICTDGTILLNEIAAKTALILIPEHA